MTPNEIQMLAVGFVLGAWTVAVWQMVLGLRDAERSLAASQTALKRAAGDQYLNSLSVYRLENRPSLAHTTPHPAALLEASVRGFELNLYDAIDRVDDALRRDGQL